MQIRIDAIDLPGTSCGPSPDSPGGYHNIHVGLQRRNRRDELLGLVAGDAPSATWTVDCTAVSSSTDVDWRGPYSQGSAGSRFIYLSWGTVDETITSPCSGERSCGLTLSSEFMDRALQQDCLSGVSAQPIAKETRHMRPPLIRWSAEVL